MKREKEIERLCSGGWSVRKQRKHNHDTMIPAPCKREKTVYAEDAAIDVVSVEDQAYGRKLKMLADVL